MIDSKSWDWEKGYCFIHFKQELPCQECIKTLHPNLIRMESMRTALKVKLTVAEIQFATKIRKLLEKKIIIEFTSFDEVMVGDTIRILPFTQKLSFAACKVEKVIKMEGLTKYIVHDSINLLGLDVCNKVIVVDKRGIGRLAIKKICDVKTLTELENQLNSQGVDGKLIIKELGIKHSYWG